MLDIKKLRQLVKLMRDNDLTELDLQDGEGEKIRVKRGSNEQEPAYVAAPPPPAAASHRHTANTAPPAAAEEAPPSGSGLGGLVEIQSPMVGTFYASPSPDADPFITVGGQVGHDTVVCIIEAMKVFNEIKAETQGTIEKVLVESGQAVEFGQPLFLVKP